MNERRNRGNHAISTLVRNLDEVFWVLVILAVLHVVGWIANTLQPVVEASWPY